MNGDRKMRIVVIGRDFPTKENNMCGSFEYEQAQMLARFGHEVYYPYIDLRSIRHWRKFGLTKEMKNGVRVIAINIPIGRLLPAFLRNKLYKPLWHWLFKKIGRDYGSPDIAHVHYPACFSYNFFNNLQKQGIKLIGTEHWSKVQEKTLSSDCLINLKNFVKNADAVCCVNKLLKKSIIELTGTKKEIVVVPNMVSSIFEPIEEEHSGFRFLSAGRLTSIKQYDKVIEAFLNVFQGQDNITLTLAGDGEEYNNLVEIIKRKNAGNQVHLLGIVSRERMAALVAETDVLVVFSEYETFCVPVIEAWTCGKPVIATTTTTAFVDNADVRLGCMVDWRSIKSLEYALSYIYEHYADYDCRWISEYAKEHFQEEAVYRKLLAIYKNLMEQ